MEGLVRMIGRKKSGGGNENLSRRKRGWKSLGNAEEREWGKRKNKEMMERKTQEKKELEDVE